MAAKRKLASAATATAAKAKPARKAADPLAAVTAERDALKLELAVTRARVEAMTAARAELASRLELAVAAVQKLIRR